MEVCASAAFTAAMYVSNMRVQSLEMNLMETKITLSL